MDAIYHWLGFVVFWGAAGYGAGWLVFILVIVFRMVGLTVLDSDVISYYLGRKIRTSELRNAYKQMGKSHRLRKLVLKYRLRNIRG